MHVEEFKRCINSDLKTFLDGKHVETLEAAVRLADDYALTHKVSLINKSNPSRRPFFPQSGSKHSPGSYSQTFIPNFLVKTRIKIPYLNQFAIIAKRRVIFFLSAYI